MQKIEIQAQPRTIIGRASKQLRKQGILPSVLYGHGFKSMPLQVSIKDFEKVFKSAGESTLIYVRVGDQQYPVIIHDVTIDGRTDSIVHADFYKVKLDEKITTEVPLAFKGESAAVKNFGAILVKNISHVDVEGFPQDLPHEIIVDISVLSDVGKHISVKDLPVPANVVIKTGADETVAVIQAARTEEQLQKELEVSTGGVEDVKVGIEKPVKEGEDAAEDGVPATPDKEEVKK